MRRLQRRFDIDSTAVQRSLRQHAVDTLRGSLRSSWRNPLAAVTVTYLFTYIGHLSRQQTGRNVSRRMVVALSNCSRIVVASRRCCNQWRRSVVKYRGSGSVTGQNHLNVSDASKN